MAGNNDEVYDKKPQRYARRQRYAMVNLILKPKGVFIATQLNWTQLTYSNSVQPSQSCFCLWRHDLQTESTVVHAVELSSVEFGWVELCRYKRALSNHNERIRTSCYLVEANYCRTQSIARPHCNSRATCHIHYSRLATLLHNNYTITYCRRLCCCRCLLKHIKSSQATFIVTVAVRRLDFTINRNILVKNNNKI